MRRFFAALLIAGIAAPAMAATTPLTLEQVERKYPTMNYVHIEKCDYDADGIFQKSEQICVANLYRSLYRDND